MNSLQLTGLGLIGRSGVSVLTLVDPARKLEPERVQIRPQSMEANPVLEMTLKADPALGVQVRHSILLNPSLNPDQSFKP